MTEQNNSKAARPALGNCRLCGEPLSRTLVDLGMSPLCESYVAEEQLNRMEPFYPLHALVCERCFLVQLGDYVTADHIYSEYAYFSSFSDSWLKHARDYVDMITERLGLGPQSLVIELASNDGYLLQNFVKKSIPVLGIDPAANIAPHAIKKGVPTLVRFFGVATARELLAQGKKADLLLGNNVLAHVPALNDFVAGMKLLLKPDGVITMEFPHLWRLMEANQFDTIYHEHFSYFSFLTAERTFARHGLTIFDVEELKTHGGSIRIYARHAEDAAKAVTARVTALRQREREEGFERLETYTRFGEQVKETKRKLLDFLIATRRAGKTVAGYGAPGKGNTLLNYCGIRTDFIDYTVDRNPYKQGKYLPGTHIPIFAPERIAQTKPDFVLILPWNLKDEIVKQLDYIREWGGKFVVPIPEVEVI
jgi:SAM-dependent methyltransferase